MYTLMITGTYSFVSVIFIATIAAFLGFFTKMAKVASDKKRILKLEDEMLSNHARILKLQKRITEMEGANKRNDVDSTTGNIKKMDDLKRKIS